MTRGATHRFVPNPLNADNHGRISGTVVLDNATGNEVALTLNYTTNKATSGNDTGMVINMTDTSSPGTSLILDIQKAGTSILCVDGANSKVGIGTTAPIGKIEVQSTNTADLYLYNEAVNFRGLSTNTATVGAGGSLTLGGSYTGTTKTGFGSLKGALETVGSQNGYLGFFTNLNGTGSVERMRITSAGNVGIGTTPNANAILDVVSTTKAFMPPRMTGAQRDAIAVPTAGMVVYNSDTNVLNFYNGAAWGAV